MTCTCTHASAALWKLSSAGMSLSHVLPCSRVACRTCCRVVSTVCCALFAARPFSWVGLPRVVADNPAITTCPSARPPARPPSSTVRVGRAAPPPLATPSAPHAPPPALCSHLSPATKQVSLGSWRLLVGEDDSDIGRQADGPDAVFHWRSQALAVDRVGNLFLGGSGGVRVYSAEGDLLGKLDVQVGWSWAGGQRHAVRARGPRPPPHTASSAHERMRARERAVLAVWGAGAWAGGGRLGQRCPPLLRPPLVLPPPSLRRPLPLCAGRFATGANGSAL
jgi:hypothetical protein